MRSSKLILILFSQTNWFCAALNSFGFSRQKQQWHGLLAASQRTLNFTGIYSLYLNGEKLHHTHSLLLRGRPSSTCSGGFAVTIWIQVFLAKWNSPQRQVFVWEAAYGHGTATGKKKLFKKVVCLPTIFIQPQWQLGQFVRWLEAAMLGISYISAHKWLHYESLQYSTQYLNNAEETALSIWSCSCAINYECVLLSSALFNQVQT